MKMRMSETQEFPMANIETAERSMERESERKAISPERHIEGKDIPSLRLDAFRDVAEGLQQASSKWQGMCERFESLGQESRLSESQLEEFSKLKGEVCDALIKGAEKLYDFVDGPEKSTLAAGRNILGEIKESSVTDGPSIIKECREIGSVIGAFIGVLITALFKGLTLAKEAYSMTKNLVSALVVGLVGFFSELFKGLERLETGSPEGFQDGGELHKQSQDGKPVPQIETLREMSHEG